MIQLSPAGSSRMVIMKIRHTAMEAPRGKILIIIKEGKKNSKVFIGGRVPHLCDVAYGHEHSYTVTVCLSVARGTTCAHLIYYAALPNLLVAVALGS